MTTEDIFLQATRQKTRFPSQRGLLLVEDLWELPLTKVKELGRTLKTQLRTQEQNSEDSDFGDNVSKNTSLLSELSLQVEILKTIVRIRTEEAEQRKLKAAKADEIAFLKNLAAEKSLDAAKSQSLDDILKRIAELEAL